MSEEKIPTLRIKNALEKVLDDMSGADSNTIRDLSYAAKNLSDVLLNNQAAADQTTLVEQLLQLREATSGPAETNQEIPEHLKENNE